MAIVSPAGPPKLSKARSTYECQAAQCKLQRPIESGEVYIGVHDYKPQRSDTGKPLTHLRRMHFTVRYHVVCFFQGGRRDQNICSYDLDQLDGFDRNGEAARKMIEEYSRTR